MWWQSRSIRACRTTRYSLAAMPVVPGVPAAALGVWGAVTSSVDWCEINYEVCSAEFVAAIARECKLQFTNVEHSLGAQLRRLPLRVCSL